MSSTKATVRKFQAVERRNTRGTVKPFKIKKILREQGTVEIKKTDK